MEAEAHRPGAGQAAPRRRRKEAQLWDAEVGSSEDYEARALCRPSAFHSEPSRLLRTARARPTRSFMRVQGVDLTTVCCLLQVFYFSA